MQIKGKVDMENKEIKTSYTMNLKNLKEFQNGYQNTGIVNKIFYILMILVLLLEYFYGNYYIIYFFTFIYFLSKILRTYIVKLNYQRRLQISNGKIPNNELYIENNIITIINTDNKNKLEYPLDKVINIAETDNLIILKMKYKLGIVLNKNNLEGATREEIIDFLFKNCSNLKNKKIYKYNKTIDKFFIAFLIVLSLLSILAMY